MAADKTGFILNAATDVIIHATAIKYKNILNASPPILFFLFSSSDNSEVVSSSFMFPVNNSSVVNGLFTRNCYVTWRWKNLPLL